MLLPRSRLPLPLVRIRRVPRLSLPCHLGARTERQHDEKRGEQSAPVQRFLRAARHQRGYFARANGSIRLGSLFLTLPTRVLTGQHVISSAG
jgi:hypothetical protein